MSAPHMLFTTGPLSGHPLLQPSPRSTGPPVSPGAPALPSEPPLPPPRSAPPLPACPSGPPVMRASLMPAAPPAPSGPAAPAEPSGPPSPPPGTIMLEELQAESAARRPEVSRSDRMGGPLFGGGGEPELVDRSF